MRNYGLYSQDFVDRAEKSDLSALEERPGIFSEKLTHLLDDGVNHITIEAPPGFGKTHSVLNVGKQRGGLYVTMNHDKYVLDVIDLFTGRKYTDKALNRLMPEASIVYLDDIFYMVDSVYLKDRMLEKGFLNVDERVGNLYDNYVKVLSALPNVGKSVLIMNKFDDLMSFMNTFVSGEDFYHLSFDVNSFNRITMNDESVKRAFNNSVNALGINVDKGAMGFLKSFLPVQTDFANFRTLIRLKNIFKQGISLDSMLPVASGMVERDLETLLVNYSRQGFDKYLKQVYQFTGFNGDLRIHALSLEALKSVLTGKSSSLSYDDYERISIFPEVRAELVSYAFNRLDTAFAKKVDNACKNLRDSPVYANGLIKSVVDEIAPRGVDISKVTGSSNSKSLDELANSSIDMSVISPEKLSEINGGLSDRESEFFDEFLSEWKVKHLGVVIKSIARKKVFANSLNTPLRFLPVKCYPNVDLIIDGEHDLLSPVINLNRQKTVLYNKLLNFFRLSETVNYLGGIDFLAPFKRALAIELTDLKP